MLSSMDPLVMNTPLSEDCLALNGELNLIVQSAGAVADVSSRSTFWDNTEKQVAYASLDLWLWIVRRSNSRSKV